MLRVIVGVAEYVCKENHLPENRQVVFNIEGLA
jgi:hypothetical protein